MFKFFYFILGNENEENCIIYIFKSLKVNKNQSDEYSLNPLNHNSQINLQLIGQSQISFYKDSYYCLCEYLFHSVYDSKSLENFELKQYLINNNSNREKSNQIDQIDYQQQQQQLETYDNYSYYLNDYDYDIHNYSINSNSSSNSIKQKQETDLKFVSNLNLNYKNSSFINYYINYLNNRDKFNFNFVFLDDKLSKAFRLIALPIDWTILGQDCYLHKGI